MCSESLFPSNDRRPATLLYLCGGHRLLLFLFSLYAGEFFSVIYLTSNYYLMFFGSRVTKVRVFCGVVLSDVVGMLHFLSLFFVVRFLDF